MVDGFTRGMIPNVRTYVEAALLVIDAHAPSPEIFTTAIVRIWREDRFPPTIAELLVACESAWQSVASARRVVAKVIALLDNAEEVLDMRSDSEEERKRDGTRGACKFFALGAGISLIGPCSHFGSMVVCAMRIIARRTLREFVEKRTAHKDQPALKAAFDEVRKARWASAADVKRLYRTASIITAERVVFNIKGNDCRLVVAIDYEKSIVWIKWLGTHADYDRLDVREVEHDVRG